MINASPSMGLMSDDLRPGSSMKLGRLQARHALAGGVKVDPATISSFCCKNLPPRVGDLARLAGLIAFKDRKEPRCPSKRWGRDLEVVVPVSEPSFWQQKQVSGTLAGAVDCATGDAWSFRFEKLLKAHQEVSQVLLDLEVFRSPLVMPYSDGLDSFAASRLLSQELNDEDLLLTTVGKTKVSATGWRRLRGSPRMHRLYVPFEMSEARSGQRLRELSCRSRGFVFNLFAGIVAHAAGASRIVIPESGQGALGPWLARVGNEAADVRANPILLRKIEALLKLVLGTSPRFDQPWLWATKGETLRAVRETAGWSYTRSCARTARQLGGGGPRIQCGVCSACLLRRQSLLVAGLDESEDRYFWHNLRSASLSDAAVAGGRSTSDNDADHARCGVASLGQMAALAGQPNFDRNISDAAAELADALGEEAHDVNRKLRRLVAAHREEWKAFVAWQGRESFLGRWAGDLQC